MKIKNKYVPLLFPLLTIIGGIITGRYFQPGNLFLYFTGVATLFFFILYLKLGNHKFILIFLYMFLFLFSGINFSYSTSPGRENIYNLIPYTGKVRARILPAARTIEAKIVKINGELKDGGKILLNYDGPPSPPGSLVEVEGDFNRPPEKVNPGQFDYKKHLRLRGIFTTVDVKNLDIISVSFTGSLLNRIRVYISDNIDTYFDPEHAGILSGMLLGRPGELSNLRREKFSRAGISHILAVSGLHVGLILYAFHYILSGLKLNKLFAMFASLAAMGLYIIITGARPSALRAGLMLTLLFLGEAWGGRGNPINSLCLAGVILLLIEPGQLFTAGFLLSFLAVGGILYLPSHLEKIPFANLPLAVSAGAVLGILPVIAWNFYYLPLMAPFINLLVIPMAGIIVNLGVFFLVIAGVSTFLAEIYSLSLSYVIGVLEYITDIVYNLGIGGIDYPRPGILSIGGYYLFLFFLGIKNRRMKTIGMLGGIVMLILGTISDLRPGNYLAALKSYRNISYLISEKGDTVLLKGKERVSPKVIENFLRYRGADRIKDIYVLHPVYSNLEGLALLANNYKTENIYYSKITGYEKGWFDFKNDLQRARVRPVKRGEVFNYSSYSIKITEPYMEFPDIRDNVVQMEVFLSNPDREIFIYTGGDPPQRKYSSIVAVDPYLPQWDKLLKYSKEKIIYSGKYPDPEGVRRVKEKGFMENIDRY